MKKIFFLLSFVLASLYSEAQINLFGGIGSRVNDSTAYVTSAAVIAAHSNGYHDLWLSNASNLWWVWTGSSYVNWDPTASGSGGATAAGATGNVQYKSAGGGLQAEAALTYDSAANILTVPLVKITSGSPGANKVLTSDADGDGAWVAGTIGAQDLFITGPAMWPAITNGGAPGVAEVSSITYQSLDFDQTTQEFAMIQFSLPRNWNNGTITATPYWTTTASSGGVVWGISGVALSNDDPFSSSFGTAQTSTDSFITASDLHIAPTTSAITIGGTPADGDLVILRVSRNPSDGSDTLNGDARLLGVRITITLDAATSE